MHVRDLSERYRLGPEIGRGSIGIIYRAEDRALNRPVAVKVMRPEMRGHQRHPARFIREAQLCGRLSHPNIVPVYDVGSMNGTPCLVMALLAGRSFRTIIRSGRISISRLLQWFTHVCYGVAFAHEADIIHRDIKPAHIFVGDFGQVVLTDWGLAKRIERRADGDELPPRERQREVTRVGDVVGTPAYMAPEQAGGRIEEIDHRADIYALGTILYEILTGTRPYEATSSMDVLRAVRRGPPELPCERVPHRMVPPALEAVCLRAMSREPGARFQSALDLAANIDAHFEARGPVEGVFPLAPDEDAETTHRSDPLAAQALAEGRAEAAGYVRQLRAAASLEAEALRLKASLPFTPPRARIAEVWRIENRARDTREQAGYHFVQAVENLQEAATDVLQEASARQELARLHRDAWRVAEEVGDSVSAQYHRARAETLDDGSLSGELARRAALSVRSGVDGSTVELASVDDRAALWTPGVRLRLGRTPLSSRTVSANRMLLRLCAPDGLVARLPLLLEPGESRVVEIDLPRSREVPPGFTFIAGGRVLLGADGAAPGAVLPREFEVASFCMARSPVTWEEYFEFLEDLLAVGNDVSGRLPRHRNRPMVIVDDRRVRWKDQVVAPGGSPARYVSKADAEAYARWLGRRLGASLRLPTDEEWEYAAGAADGRPYPWGGEWVAGIADTRRPGRRGPAPIAAFPDDESPFGLRTVAGGVREWTSSLADDADRFVLRGGSWRAHPDQCRLCARASGAADLTHESIGVRLAADLSDHAGDRRGSADGSDA